MPRAHVNDVDIVYEVQGEGAPMVLIPGLGTGRIYYEYSASLLAKDFRVVTYDPRGIGESDAPDGPYSMELWADDVAALLNHLGMDSCHIVGSSLGGCVATALADRHPERIRSLIMVATFPRLDRSLQTNFELRDSIVKKLGFRRELHDHVLLWTLSRKFIETRRGEEVYQGLLASLTNLTPELYSAFLKSILDYGGVKESGPNAPPYYEKLRSYPWPTLLICGADDILTPVFLSREMHNLMPNSELAIIPDCGHITFVEKPEENCRLVREFARKVEQNMTA